jgi:serine/threonine-protein kinase
VEGTPFGRYRLIELLGRGGMGEVWRAHDTAANNRTVAIKLLPAHLAADDMFVARFRREADAAAQLNNPHVIPIHQYGEIDGRLYVDMRLVEGRDLQEVLNEGPLEPARAVRIIEQVAKALRAAHKIGLIHRDVKPSNILIDEDDFAYLIDFGIARGADQTGLTGTGAAIGSWHYMAPERMRAQEADARADIYALACVLYECLTAHRPFPGDSTESQVAAHLMEPPPQPSTALPTVPTRFDTVIAKGMAKDPDQRYATTVELATAARDAITAPIERPTPRPTQLPATEAPPGPTLLDDATRPATPPRQPGRQPGPPPRAADRPPPDTGTPPRPWWWRRQRRGVKSAIIAALVVVLAAAGITGYVLRPISCGLNCAVALPFTGLKQPWGVAVDSAGNLYVTDSGNKRVLELAAGSATPTVLPFTGLKQPRGVAVDAAGNVYVVDSFNDRVVELAAGSATPTVLPFTGLNSPQGVAVDTAGNLYVSDPSNNRVVRLAAGSTTPTVLPFTGLNSPQGAAVDTAGDLYVIDGDPNKKRVVKLAAGSSTQTVLPFTGHNDLWGVAVDSAGNLYVTQVDNPGVLKLATGSATPTMLPFTGLNSPRSVAVDTAGNLYVTQINPPPVLKLAAG